MRRREFIALVGGAAITSPLVVRAQDKRPVVGVLSPQSPGSAANRFVGFVKGLAEQGYVVGQNVAIEYRWADGHYDRMPTLAADLVSRNVDVIAAPTQDAAVVARAATSIIPIVFNTGGDPVKLGLAASMNRPGGNATGTSMLSSELGAKRLGLLHEMAPKAAVVGVLLNPSNVSAAHQASELRAAAQSLGLQLNFQQVKDDADLAGAFEEAANAGARVLFAAADPFLASRRERLVALAAKYAIPAMWEWPDFVESGGLMSYGPSIVDAYRQVGVYVGRVLKGEKAADLPILQPVQFILAINLSTVKALGLELPATLLARADEVIE